MYRMVKPRIRPAAVEKGKTVKQTAPQKKALRISSRKTMSSETINLSGDIGSRIIIGFPDDKPIFVSKEKGMTDNVFFK